jgi:hypothetical protein
MTSLFFKYKPILPNRYKKTKKPLLVTREEKRKYFEKLDYNSTMIECYYKLMETYMIIYQSQEDTARIQLTYDKCLPIILLMSSGNNDASS